LGLKQKARRGGAGRAEGKDLMLLRVDAVGALASLGLEGLDLVPSPFQRSSDESADAVRLPAHLLHNLGQRSSALALEHGDDLSRLAALAGTSLRLGWFRCLSAFGRFLRRGGLFPRLDLRGRALGARGRSRRRFCGGSVSGVTAPFSLCRAFQIRATAIARVSNFLTGFSSVKGATPAKLFQTSTKRSAGQPAAQPASSSELTKGCAPAAITASAWSRVANAVMLFSVSMVNVVIVYSPVRGIRVHTWITRIPLKSKAIRT
jgi:hypothetical protein